MIYIDLMTVPCALYFVPMHTQSLESYVQKTKTREPDASSAQHLYIFLLPVLHNSTNLFIFPMLFVLLM